MWSCFLNSVTPFTSQCQPDRFSLPFLVFPYISFSLSELTPAFPCLYQLITHDPSYSPKFLSICKCSSLHLEGLLSIHCSPHSHSIQSPLLFPLEVLSHLHKKKRISTVSRSPFCKHTWDSVDIFSFVGVQHRAWRIVFMITIPSPQGFVLQEQREQAFL